MTSICLSYRGFLSDMHVSVIIDCTVFRGQMQNKQEEAYAINLSNQFGTDDLFA